MLYLGMALKAIDSMIGHMLIMNERRIFVSFRPLDMTGIAAFPGNIARA
jgi:hypothetical protein